jgi:hypothetical protein
VRPVEQCDKYLNSNVCISESTDLAALKRCILFSISGLPLTV